MFIIVWIDITSSRTCIETHDTHVWLWNCVNFRRWGLARLNRLLPPPCCMCVLHWSTKIWKILSTMNSAMSYVSWWTVAPQMTSQQWIFFTLSHIHQLFCPRDKQRNSSEVNMIPPEIISPPPSLILQRTFHTIQYMSVE